MFLPFKNQNYLTLDNLSKYEHITLKFVGRYLYWVAKIFSKKKGYFRPKIGGRRKIVKIRFQLFKGKKKKKKNPRPLSPTRGGGGGKALMSRPLREELFFRLPLQEHSKPLHSSDRVSTWNSWSAWSTGAH